VRSRGTAAAWLVRVNARQPKREPVSHIDAAWLGMDSPTNAMVITSLLVFDDPPGYPAIESFVRERLLSERRFRQLAQPPRVPLGAWHWELDPEFDAATHLHRVALPSPAGERELQALIGDLVGTPLPRERPLWQLHYVEGYGPGAAIVVRVHHAVGDGVALVRLLLGITDQGEQRPAEVGLRAPHASGPVDFAKQAAGQATTLGRLLLLPADQRTALKGALGRRKRAVFSGPLSLEQIKVGARRLGGKTNDLLMSAIAGALRSHLLQRGDRADDLEIRALVPVYVHPNTAFDGLGNHFGLVFVPLAVGVADRLERFREMKRRMDLLKASPDAVVALGVLGALGVASSELEHVAIDLFTRKATVMVTNVPGPRGRISIAGKPLSSLVVWAPISGHLGLGMSLMTYAGEARLGISSDAGLVPEPEALITAFEHEIAQLV
jgi:diacylglycerol O-acyltransferase / wax synthase